MIRQLFANNIDTMLAAGINSSGSEMTLEDGAGLPTGNLLATDEFVRLTLTDGVNHEVVSMVVRAGNTINAYRGEEGTTAREWPAGTRVFAGVTAGTMDRYPQSEPAGSTSSHVQAVNIQPSRSTDENIASGLNSTAVGRDTKASGPACSALGSFASATAESATATGASSKAHADYACSFGAWSQSYAPYGLALGGGYIPAAADASAAMGDVSSLVQHTLALGYMPAVPNATWGWAATDSWWAMQAPGTTICLPAASLTATGTQTITLPAGLRFFPDEVGLIVTAADTVTVQPTVRFGVTGSNGSLIAAVATTDLTSVGARQRFQDLLSDAGVTSMVFEVTVAGTATGLSARPYFRGTAVVDEGVDGEA